MKSVVFTVASDGSERQTEAGDGGRPLQHPAAEEETEREEEPGPEERWARAWDCGKVLI